MALDLFMKFDDPQIIGTSTFKGHEREFELFSLSYGAVPLANGVSLSPITVTLKAHNGPRLLNALARGQRLGVVFQSVVSGGQSLTVYETITLTNARLTRFQESMSGGDDVPALELAFAYDEIEYKQAGINFTYSN
jgi:type VI protein secretion system component Hcp